MKHHRLEDMVGGWMVGDFEPTCIKSDACEVACKMYDANVGEASHVHRVATELTLIASEKVTGKVLDADDQRRLIDEAVGEIDFDRLASRN